MTLQRRRFLGVLAGGVLAAASGCLDGTGADGATTERPHRMVVEIEDGAFTPASLEAAAGHDVTVVFENHDDREHALRAEFADLTVTVPAGGTASRQVTVPEEPGDYEISCPGTESVLAFESVPADVLGGCRIDDE